MQSIEMLQFQGQLDNVQRSIYITRARTNHTDADVESGLDARPHQTYACKEYMGQADIPK